MTTILDWLFLVVLILLGLIVVVASLWKDEARHRADEILDRERDWDEWDFSETAMHNNKQGGTSTQNSRQPSPKSFGRN